MRALTGRSIVMMLLLQPALGAVARAEPAGEAAVHLLAGVRAFRADRYQEALAEFRQVERAGGGVDLAVYLGPTLYKLERYDEARAVLARAHRAGARDAVSEYYLGLTYYRLGLVRLARSIFVALDAASGGPRLAEGASRFVAAIDAMAVGAGTIEHLLAAAQDEAGAGAAFDLAIEAWLRAAPGSPDRGRAAAVAIQLAPAADAAGAVLDLIGPGDDLPAALRLALARLAIASGAPARAAPLLEDVRQCGDATMRAAAEELAHGRP